MIVEKVLNNNVVVSIDPKTKKEVILMGCGIAFNKKVGQEVDESKIEKTFIIDNQNLGNKIKLLINQIPDGIFELVDELIKYANKELNVSFDKQIYISLADHIAFAIKRYKKNILLKNDLLEEIRRVHRSEFKVALQMLNYINNKLKINLPEDEAAFITLHLVNASYNENTEISIKGTKIVRDILDIIKSQFNLEFKEEDLNYDRLLTHLKYFSKRILNNSQHSNENNELLNIISNSYVKSYNCALIIKDYILDLYKYNVSDDEVVYLTLHIQRVVSVAMENRINN